MNDRWLISSFTASSLIHLSLIPVAALVMHAKPLSTWATPSAPTSTSAAIAGPRA